MQESHDLPPEAFCDLSSVVATKEEACGAEAKGGYIALLSLLMVAALTASTVLILFTTSVNQVQNVADTEKGLVALNTANSCIERALESIREAGATSLSAIEAAVYGIGTHNVGGGTCSIIADTVVSHGSILYAFKVRGEMTNPTGTVIKYIQVRIAVPLDAAISLLSWEESAT